MLSRCLYRQATETKRKAGARRKGATLRQDQETGIGYERVGEYFRANVVSTPKEKQREIRQRQGKDKGKQGETRIDKKGGFD